MSAKIQPATARKYWHTGDTFYTRDGTAVEGVCPTIRCEQMDIVFVSMGANAEDVRDMRDRIFKQPQILEALRGVMGLVQLLASAHDYSATSNHRYVDAAALLRSLGESA